jgi:DnaJ-class molecular chaperone
MKDKDHYNILGISREESAEEINEAYSILRNRNKRKYYDLKGYKLFSESYSRGGSYGFQAYWPQRSPHNPFK